MLEKKQNLKAVKQADQLDSKIRHLFCKIGIHSDNTYLNLDEENIPLYSIVNICRFCKRKYWQSPFDYRTKNYF